MNTNTFGKIILFGSGEASPSGKTILRKILSAYPKRINVAILETPAGFQPNSEMVAREIADIFSNSLPEFIRSISIIPARKKSTVLSPDNPDLMAPLAQSDFILLGPGSPTYAVKQLSNSLAWKVLKERWQKGTTLCLSSAAALACGRFTLPVYEIYKAGEDLHWVDGLDLFQSIGLSLTVITHWNNTEGGKDLDTGFCYMGKKRFEKLLKLLPRNQSVMGIDENTAVIFDFAKNYFYLEGKGNLTIIKNGKKLIFNTRKYYSMDSIIHGKLIEIKKPKLYPTNSGLQLLSRN